MKYFTLTKNTVDLTLPFLVATDDFLSAVSLAKTYPEMNTNKELITKLIAKYGLPNNSIATIEELEKVLIDNLFTERIPTSLRLHYWYLKYFFVDAMRLAAANNDTVFLDTYREYFGLGLIDKIETIRYLLHDVKMDSNGKVPYFGDEIIFLTDHGYLEKILPQNLERSFNRVIYVQQILRKEKWELFSDTSIDVTEKEIFEGLLASGNLEYLQNPPKEITTRIESWKVDKEYYTKLWYAFPLNLPNAEFVEYFKEQILRLGIEHIQELLKDRNIIEYSEGFQAVVKLFPPDSISVKTDDLAMGRFVTHRQQTEIVELLGGDPLTYHEQNFEDFMNDEINQCVAHLRIVEVVRLKGNPEKIIEHLTYYLHIYPDPILILILEGLVM